MQLRAFLRRMFGTGTPICAWCGVRIAQEDVIRSGFENFCCEQHADEFRIERLSW